jgi:hypothetical protein
LNPEGVSGCSCPAEIGAEGARRSLSQRGRFSCASARRILHRQSGFQERRLDERCNLRVHRRTAEEIGPCQPARAPGRGHQFLLAESRQVLRCRQRRWVAGTSRRGIFRTWRISPLPTGRNCSGRRVNTATVWPVRVVNSTSKVRLSGRMWTTVPTSPCARSCAGASLVSTTRSCSLNTGLTHRGGHKIAPVESY